MLDKIYCFVAVPLVVLCLFVFVVYNDYHFVLTSERSVVGMLDGVHVDNSHASLYVGGHQYILDCGGFDVVDLQSCVGGKVHFVYAESRSAFQSSIGRLLSFEEVS